MQETNVPIHGGRSVDDLPTLAELGLLAFALANLGHEALGHGLATLAVGGKALLLSTCNFESGGNYSRWIPAAGGLMNLAIGLGSLAILRLMPHLGSMWRYFLVLVAAFNLFFAFGYPAYSGIAQFGDWAAVISGFNPRWPWRVLLVVVSVVGYYGSMRLLAKPIAPFAGNLRVPTTGLPDTARLGRMTLVPYIAAMVLASLAGARNPNGWRTMLTAGLPAAAAAFGLTQMDQLIGAIWKKDSQEIIGPLLRSRAWILAAVVVLALFIGVLGPGIRFSQP